MDIVAEIYREIGSSFEATPPAAAAIRMVFAIVLGAIVGLEREMHASTAGLRTHILISLAACLFALISFEIVALSQADPAAQNTDMLRLIEAVTAGVAFLAAGSIIVSGGKVQGLTTGAGMWLAGAIGLSCGVGKLGLALMATFLAVIILWLLGRVSRSIKSDPLS